jgi:hypothetical protein
VKLKKAVAAFVFLSLTTMLLFIGHANATSWQYYSGNHCLSFDGTDDTVSCSSLVYRANPLTIELWVKPSYTIQTGSNASYGRILGAIISSTATWVGFPDINQGGWALYFDYSDGHLYFKYREPTGYYTGAVVTIGTNRDVWNSSSWYHIAVTHSYNFGLAIYVNTTVDKTTPPDNNGIAYDTSELDIGGYSNSGYMFQGLIDEVRLWNVTRTYSEISDSWNRVLNDTECNTPDLVGYWRFDEGAGMESKDFSLQGNNASLGLTPYDPLWVTIPEFPSFLMLPLFIMATLLAVIVYKKKAQTSSEYRKLAQHI